MIQEVKYKGVFIEVHGNYDPHDAGDWEIPPSVGSFEVEKIMLKDTDVAELLEGLIEEIEELVFNKVNDF